MGGEALLRIVAIATGESGLLNTKSDPGSRKHPILFKLFFVLNPFTLCLVLEKMEGREVLNF